MRDYLEIGCTPVEEPCFPVGHELARKECFVYKAQLERAYPGVEFQVRANRHDFGTYYEVAAYFDSDDADAKAYDAECGCEYWDDKAKRSLHTILQDYLRHNNDPAGWARFRPIVEFMEGGVPVHA